jgi:hypothetical protein
VDSRFLLSLYQELLSGQRLKNRRANGASEFFFEPMKVPKNLGSQAKLMNKNIVKNSGLNGSLRALIGLFLVLALYV